MVWAPVMERECSGKACVCERDSVCECVCVCVEVEQVGWGWGNGSDQHLVARSGFLPLDTLFFFKSLLNLL